MSYIIFDLDETLLNNQREVSDYTKSVLDRLRSMGHKIVINTARSKMTNQVIFDRIQPDYAILCGGSGIIDKDGEYIYKCEIPKEKVRAISEELSSLGITFSVQGDPYLYSNNPEFTRFDVMHFNHDEFDYNFDSPKLIVNLADRDSEYFANKYDIEVVSYFGGPLYRFNHKDATKAKGNSALVKMLGGSESDIIAFGDDEGDVDMLQEAGIGVIMKNAKDSVKSKVSRVTEYTNDEDGVAKFLEKHFGI